MRQFGVAHEIIKPFVTRYLEDIIKYVLPFHQVDIFTGL